jgi:16S rRNA (cytidine1402-2'-O)-methyltransferase
MPLNCPDDRQYVLPGHLYIVATPIGNLDDITLRALSVLKQVDLLAAEDTRHTKNLLQAYGISRQLISCHEYNEAERANTLVNQMKSGVSVALVSNAGTPTISDPGFRLVRAATENDIPVVPIPGACAVIAALCASGLPTDAFVFAGFLDKKKQKRLGQMEKIKAESRTVILYESPRRILSLVEELAVVLGENRQAVLSREMTKLHEEFIRGGLCDIFNALKDRGDIKGECVLLIAGAEKEPAPLETLQAEIRSALLSSSEKPAVLSRMIADKLGFPRNVVYDEIRRLKTEDRNKEM